MNSNVTHYEVECAAHNAALVANCQCPARYRATEWEPIWRKLRAERLAELLAA